MHRTLEELHTRLAPHLGPLGLLYGALMRLREEAYAREVLESWRPPAPCVSVGNIAMGGGGKTPLAGWLLGWARAQGLKAAVLSRGYGAVPPELPFVVGAGSRPEEAGDEPLLLAREHPCARVVVDPMRRRGGLFAAGAYDPDLYVLDDGFQHLGVRRHVDLVLLTAHDLRGGWNRTFPAGRWREGKAALRRAAAFLVKAAPKEWPELRSEAERRLKAHGKPVFFFCLAPTAVTRLDFSQPEPDLGGEPYLFAAGIADPAQAAATAAAFLGQAPREVLAFPDHHAYTPADVRRLRETAGRLGCRAILATPKDAVKLAPLADAAGGPRLPLRTLRLEVAFGPSLLTPHAFPAWWDNTWETLAVRQR